jgi:ABC-type bacteriocin/lantibiotic exporter with double-glycine peptidase domain
MRTIRQRQEDDCGIACVAMLARVSYDRALDEGFDGDSGLTDTIDVVRALQRLGGRPKTSRLIPKRTKDHRSFEFDALLLVNYRKNRVGHWVVWDSLHGKIRDPLRYPYKRYNVRSYLRVD